MTDVSPGEIAHTLPEWSLSFIDLSSAELSQVPEQWLPIVRSADPKTRREAAIGLWNQSFLDLVPQFASALRTRLVDVRVCLSLGEGENCPVLVYVIEDEFGGYATWVGYDPRTFALPSFWDSFPDPVQVFLQNVHAGFVSAMPSMFGLRRPVNMVTLADLAGRPDGIPDWMDQFEIPSTRLLLISTDGGWRYLVCPDIPPGQLVSHYSGELMVEEFGPRLDSHLISRLELYFPWEGQDAYPEPPPLRGPLVIEEAKFI